MRARWGEEKGCGGRVGLHAVLLGFGMGSLETVLIDIRGFGVYIIGTFGTLFRFQVGIRIVLVLFFPFFCVNSFLAYKIYPALQGSIVDAKIRLEWREREQAFGLGTITIRVLRLLLCGFRLLS